MGCEKKQPSERHPWNKTLTGRLNIIQYSKKSSNLQN